MKKKYLLILSFTFGVLTSIFAQNLLWKAEVNSFFDNTEFSNSKVQIPQTMAGVHFAPEIGISFHEKNRIFIGIDVLHEFGSDEFIDYHDPIIYYEYAGNPFRFYMGAVPRKKLLDKYPRMFFQDSINNYRPTINGFFWELNKDKNYANVWLDWTGRQSKEKNEAFFVGWSGRFNYKSFYVQHFGYMFHFAKKKDPVIDEAIHDNGLILTSVGLDLADRTGFEKLEINAGWSLGLDRDRELGKWETPQAFVSEMKVEYRGLGLFNSLYVGNKQQKFRNDHGSNLYWGDPFYRLKKYDRADLYINFFKSKVVNLKLICSFHFAESSVYNEQALYASFDLDNFSSKKEKKYRYIWDNWF